MECHIYKKKKRKKITVQYIMQQNELAATPSGILFIDEFTLGTFSPNFLNTVQITFIFIDFRVCDFAFAFKTQNAPCVSRFKRVLFSDRFQFAF